VISDITDDLIHRALPKLPDPTPEKNDTVTTSFRKWLTVSQKEEKQINIQKPNTTPKRVISSMFTKKTALHCKSKFQCVFFPVFILTVFLFSFTNYQPQLRQKYANKHFPLFFITNQLSRLSVQDAIACNK
jgi:hypothetical protein